LAGAQAPDRALGVAWPAARRGRAGGAADAPRLPRRRPRRSAAGAVGANRGGRDDPPDRPADRRGGVPPARSAAARAALAAGLAGRTRASETRALRVVRVVVVWRVGAEERELVGRRPASTRGGIPPGGPFAGGHPPPGLDLDPRGVALGRRVLDQRDDPARHEPPGPDGRPTAGHLGDLDDPAGGRDLEPPAGARGPDLER